jgi:dephospho-CoA kinase
LIYELGIADRFDAVVVVRAPKARQLEWLMRRGLSEAAARQRIGAQMPAEDKAQRATYVVDNDGPPEKLAAEADRLVAAVAGLPVRPAGQEIKF